jgi:bifunctional ADP-heptose synthase (sugar kinase/adenylyltransferase)
LNELSIETGKIAYQVARVRSYPGAVGTVINNLAALGVGRIYPIAFIGDDGEGYELRQALKKLPAVEQGGIISVPDRRTPTYTKPMLGKEELNRLDIKNRLQTPDEAQGRIIELLDAAWPELDALLVLDQVSEAECGVVTRRVRVHIAELGARETNKFVLADSRERIGLFRNVCVKPNELELLRAAGADESVDTAESYLEAQREMTARIWNRVTFATRGVSGIDVIDARDPVDISEQEVAAYPVSGPIDIVGAGDSCSAGIASAMVSGLTHEQAAAFGNLIASITIQQIGVTGTASPEQVRARWREVSVGYT